MYDVSCSVVVSLCCCVFIFSSVAHLFYSLGTYPIRLFTAQGIVIQYKEYLYRELTSCPRRHDDGWVDTLARALARLFCLKGVGLARMQCCLVRTRITFALVRVVYERSISYLSRLCVWSFVFVLCRCCMFVCFDEVCMFMCMCECGVCMLLCLCGCRVASWTDS